MTAALLLVDIQNDYFPGGRMELRGMEAAAAKAGELLAAFRRDRRPTFYIQHLARRPDAPFFLPGTPGVELHQSIRPRPDEPVIYKYYPNSFRDTDLLDRLRSAQIGALVICGAMSHMCIDATTRAAADYGFRCRVVHDACATRDLTFNGVVVPAAQVHAAFMAALSPLYAEVLALKEVLQKLGVSG
jgi:nicotinamidase-related amidase